MGNMRKTSCALVSRATGLTNRDPAYHPPYTGIGSNAHVMDPLIHRWAPTSHPIGSFSSCAWRSIFFLGHVSKHTCQTNWAEQLLVKAEIDHFIFFITALLFVSWSLVESFWSWTAAVQRSATLLDNMSFSYQTKSLYYVFFILQALLAVVLAQNGQLVFQEDFNTLDRNRWQHLITAWRGGNNEFQYYTNRTENR